MPADLFTLIALAIGAAARVLVRAGYTEDQAVELMRRAWRIVQE